MYDLIPEIFFKSFPKEYSHHWTVVLLQSSSVTTVLILEKLKSVFYKININDQLSLNGHDDMKNMYDYQQHSLIQQKCCCFQFKIFISILYRKVIVQQLMSDLPVAACSFILIVSLKTKVFKFIILINFSKINETCDKVSFPALAITQKMCAYCSCTYCFKSVNQFKNK